MFIEKLSYMHIFHSVCHKMLPRDQFAELSEMAKSKQEERIKQEANN